MWLGCIVTGLDTFTFLAVHYLGVRSSFFFGQVKASHPSHLSPDATLRSSSTFRRLFVDFS